MGVKCSELLVLEFGVTLEGLKGEYQYFYEQFLIHSIKTLFTWHSFSTVCGFELEVFIAMTLSYEIKYKDKGSKKLSGF